MFIDQLLTNPHIDEDIKKVLRMSIVIDATHVSDYWNALPHQWVGSADFPNIAPPLESFFLEYKAPPQYWDALGRPAQWPHYFPVQWGELCTSKRIDDGWHLTFRSFAKYKQNNIQWCLGPFMQNEIDVQSNGKPAIAEPDYAIPSSIGHGHYLDWQDTELDAYKIIKANTSNSDSFASFPCWGDFYTALLTISFMHCKNVVIRKEVPPAVQQTAKQKRQRVKPYQPVTYHVLDIEPMKTILKTEGKSEQVGLQRALHICRGHFSTYTEDKKLFGKYAGIFWIPQHVRGSAEVGFATKDYRIKLEK